MPEQKVEVADVNEEYMNNFKECFSLQKLRELADDEEEKIKNPYIQKKMCDMQKQGFKGKTSLYKKEEYELCYPKTIKYLKENIFMSDTAVFYINSMSADKAIMPKEMSKDQVNNYKTKFPEDIKVYFEKHYLDVYHVVINQNKPRVYEEESIKYLNLFQGYKFDGKVRDQKLCDDNKDKVKFIWEHIRNVWCNGNEIYYKEVRNWICALIVGRRKMKTAIYLKGMMGIGKGKICELLSWIIGTVNTLTLTTEDPFKGQFNGELAGKTFVNLNEIVNSHEDFVSLYNRLKPWITDPFIRFRDLFSKPIMLANLSSFILTGNHDMFKLENNGSDRRFIILDSKDTLNSDEYNTKLDEYCVQDDKVKEAFYWSCVDNYDPKYNEQISIKTLPMSETKKMMVLKTLSIMTQYLKCKLEDSEFFNQPMLKSDFYANYSEWYKSQNNKKEPPKKDIFYTELLDREYKSFIKYKKARVNGNPNNYICTEPSKLYAYMEQKGYISKYDDIAERYKCDVKPQPKNKSFVTEYWELEIKKLELEMQKMEIEDMQHVLQMKMLGVYDDYTKRYEKIMERQEQENDELEYGIVPVQQTIEQTIEQTITAPKTIKSSSYELDSQSKKNIINTTKKLNEYFNKDFFTINF